MTYENDKIRIVIDNTIIDVINKESHLFGSPKEELAIEDLTSKSRKKEKVLARQLGMYISDFIFNVVLGSNIKDTYIGSFYGKGRCAAIYSKNTIRDYQETSEQILNITTKCIETILRDIDNGEISLSVGLPRSILYPAYY